MFNLMKMIQVQFIIQNIEIVIFKYYSRRPVKNIELGCFVLVITMEARLIQPEIWSTAINLNDSIIINIYNKNIRLKDGSGRSFYSQKPI